MAKMTQVEFDNKMREINAQQNAEYKEVDTLMVENLRQQDMVRVQINSMKEVLASYKAQNRDLTARKKDIARKYHEQKNQLIVDNPKAYGTPTEKGEGITMREAHALRRKMLEEIKAKFADVPGIDCDNINVQFKVEGNSISFETIIPKIS